VQWDFTDFTDFTYRRSRAGYGVRSGTPTRASQNGGRKSIIDNTTAALGLVLN
jgi:hypothetical protein